MQIKRQQPRFSIRIYLSVMLIIAFRVSAIGQVPTDPVLVDEYDSASCDDFLARLDGFLSEMRAHPDSKAIIVITNPPERRHGSVMLKRMIEAHFSYKEFDGSRVQIVRVDGKSFHRAFWRIPPGASEPKIEGPALAFQISDTIRSPFMLANDEPEQICPQVDDDQIYAEFLKGNPSARGNIVVHDQSERKARRRARSILKKFQVKYGISRNRLRTFTARLTPTNLDWPVVEYWYLP